MKKLLQMILLLVLPLSFIYSAEEIRLYSENLTFPQLLPGTINAIVLKFRAVNFSDINEYYIDSITVLYNGDTNDIADISAVISWTTEDDFDSPTRTLFETGKTFTPSAVFNAMPNCEVKLPHGTTRYIFVTCQIDLTVTGGNLFDAEIQSSNDITSSAPSIIGSFPLNSSPNGYITVIPDRLGIYPIPSPQTAGSPFNITVYPMDQWGNKPQTYSGSQVTVTNNQGVVASNYGNTPVLPANVPWPGGTNELELSVTTFNSYTGALLDATDTVLGSTTSSAFNVNGTNVTHYTLIKVSPSGSGPFASGTTITFQATARDPYGNRNWGYDNKPAIVTRTDDIGYTGNITFNNGIVQPFNLIFPTIGSHTIRVEESGNQTIYGEISVSITFQANPAAYGISAPSMVFSGRGFSGSVRALDAYNNQITTFNEYVDLSVHSPATIIPSRVKLTNGVWSGQLTISGEVLQTPIIGTGSGISGQSNIITVKVLNYQQAIAYPTVFKPREQPVRIRYNLAQDAKVTIKIFNMNGDLGRVIEIPSGSIGAKQGLNVMEWDGRDGFGNIGHSGVYNILIDKGYEKQWTTAVIRNY